MANRKPIRWAVPPGGESYMGLAQYFLTHEENMRKSFSQPSRSVRRTLPDGTTIDYIMNDVVDCIRISPPKGMQRAVGKKMTWDKLPPFELGDDGKATENIDLSQMTADPDVSGGYYCTVSVINGTDENGRMLPATFSVKMSTGSAGWSIKQGIRQIDGSYKVDGKSATLLLGADAGGDCELFVRDGKSELVKRMSVIADEDVFILLKVQNGGVSYWAGLDSELNFTNVIYSSAVEKTLLGQYDYSMVPDEPTVTIILDENGDEYQQELYYELSTPYASGKWVTGGRRLANRLFAGFGDGANNIVGLSIQDFGEASENKYDYTYHIDIDGVRTDLATLDNMTGNGQTVSLYPSMYSDRSYVYLKYEFDWTEFMVTDIRSYLYYRPQSGSEVSVQCPHNISGSANYIIIDGVNYTITGPIIIADSAS